jgi:hypothetical protein
MMQRNFEIPRMPFRAYITMGERESFLQLCKKQAILED